MPLEKLANQKLSALSPEMTFNKSLDDEVRILYPDAKDLVGRLQNFRPVNASQAERLALCAARCAVRRLRYLLQARYHDHLSLMGKAKISDPAEDILRWSGRRQRLAS